MKLFADAFDKLLSVSDTPQARSGRMRALLLAGDLDGARGEADRKIREAEGYAIERVNRAQGDVTRFAKVLEEYNRNPGVTRALD